MPQNSRCTGSGSHRHPRSCRRGWQVPVSGDTLRITTPVARVKDIQQVEIPQPLTSYIDRIRTSGQSAPAPSFRIVVDLDRPAPWQANFSRTVTPPPPPAPVKPPEVPN